MSTTEEVQEVLYDFTQRCFIGEKGKQKLNLSKQSGLFDVLSSGSLSVMEVAQLTKNHQKLLKELLSQYIIFLQMNQELPFPSGFLQGSDKNVLGEPVLQYICEHRWPFPQLLQGRE